VVNGRCILGGHVRIATLNTKTVVDKFTKKTDGKFAERVPIDARLIDFTFSYPQPFSQTHAEVRIHRLHLEQADAIRHSILITLMHAVNSRHL